VGQRRGGREEGGGAGGEVRRGGATGTQPAGTTISVGGRWGTARWAGKRVGGGVCTAGANNGWKMSILCHPYRDFFGVWLQILEFYK
jgi:hypothetical protein